MEVCGKKEDKNQRVDFRQFVAFHPRSNYSAGEPNCNAIYDLSQISHLGLNREQWHCLLHNKSRALLSMILDSMNSNFEMTHTEDEVVGKANKQRAGGDWTVTVAS